MEMATSQRTRRKPDLSVIAHYLPTIEKAFSRLGSIDIAVIPRMPHGEREPLDAVCFAARDAIFAIDYDLNPPPFAIEPPLTSEEASVRDSLSFLWQVIQRAILNRGGGERLGSRAEWDAELRTLRMIGHSPGAAPKPGKSGAVASVFNADGDEKARAVQRLKPCQMKAGKVYEAARKHNPDWEWPSDNQRIFEWARDDQGYRGQEFATFARYVTEYLRTIGEGAGRPTPTRSIARARDLADARQRGR